MKHNILQSIKIITLIMIFVAGSTLASAFTEPTDAPPSGNVAAPINTGSFDQEKQGSITAKYIKSGLAGTIIQVLNSVGLPLTFDLAGWILAEKIIIAPWGVFANLHAGDVLEKNLGAVSIDLNGILVDETQNTHGAGLQIDVRNGDRTTGKNVLRLLAQEIGSDRTTTVMNKPFFQLLDTLNNKEGIFQGRSIQISEGGAARGKVLVSGDNKGTGVWANLGVSSQALIPDIKMVKGQWKMTGDGESRTLSCPTDYVAIAVACDSNHDAGYDTCALTPSIPGGTQSTATLSQNGGGFPTGGVVSSNANKDSENQMWLTCIRAVSYPAVNLTPSIPVAPTFDANGLEIINSGGGTETPTWQTVSYPEGANGQTCSSWLTINDPGYDRFDYRTNSGLGFPSATGNCVYASGTSTFGFYTDCKSQWASPGATYKPVSSCSFMTGNPLSPAGFTLEKLQ